jgi:Fe2+ transport system protein B
VVRSIAPEEAAKLERDNQLLQKQIQQLRETIDAMMAEASEVTSIPSMVESNNDTASFTLCPTFSGSTDYDDDDEQAKRMAELEAQVEKLETRLHKATNNLRKSARASAVELPALQMQMELMEEELLQADDLKEENESMHQQLVDLKAEAESSRLAANKMYQLLQEVKQEKQLHQQWERKETTKVQILAKEGHSWSIFIILILFFQIFLTCVGFAKMAYHQNMNPSSLETQMGAILESMENLPDSCKAA